MYVNSMKHEDIKSKIFYCFYIYKDPTLQISTSDKVKYIQSLCLHISRTVLRLLGLLK